MSDKVNLLVILGSVREGRSSEMAARYIENRAKTDGRFEVKFADPRDFTFPPEGDGHGSEGRDPKYTELTAWANAFFIVTPEYNHSFPGTLKRMLDSELKNYFHKPVAVAGVSSGPWGGTRVVESLVPTLRRMGFVLNRFEMYFPEAYELFDDEGNLDPAKSEHYETRSKQMLDELHWFATKLR